MKTQLIEERGELAGLSGLDLKIFVKFFSQRFPDESDNITSYVDEWANRFVTNSHFGKMDSHSKSIFLQVSEEILGELL